MKGKTPIPMREIPVRTFASVWKHVDIRGPFKCWPWLGYRAPEGYGRTGWTHGEPGARDTAAHRVIWMSIHGPVPPDLVVDHICHERGCCNPAHLRLLTPSRNSSLNAWSRKTHCAQGHEYTEENTRRIKSGSKQGTRSCRTCGKAWCASQYLRRKQMKRESR